MRHPSRLWSTAAGLALFGAAVLWLVPRGEPRFGGAFSLTDTHGVRVTEASLRGRPFALFFGFTRCPSVCPRALGRLTHLRHALGPEGKSLTVLFVSVDPEDTAGDLDRYLAAYSLPIIGLTGGDSARDEALRAYRAFAGPAKSHTGSVFLVSAQGESVGTLEPSDTDEAALTKLQSLVR